MRRVRRWSLSRAALGGALAALVIEGATALVVTPGSSVGVNPAAAEDPPVPDAFQCYMAKASAGTPPFIAVTGLPVVDPFGPATLDVTKTARLCAPASVDGADPTAPAHPEHLESTRQGGRRARRDSGWSKRGGWSTPSGR